MQAPAVFGQPVTDIYGRDVSGLSIAAQVQAIDAAFDFWRSQGFPYPKTCINIAVRELELLKSIGSKDLDHVLKHPSSVGLRTANSLQRSIWKVKVKGRSPLECFENDESLKKILVRAVRLRQDRKCWSANEIRTFCGLFNRSRASNFRPTVAKVIYEKYSGVGSQVLDFSAGFGGRAFAAIAAAREYHGIDPENSQVAGINELKMLVGEKVKTYVGCAEDILPTIDDASFELIFSSPPYFNLEKYSPNLSQSYKRYPEFEAWVSGFLQPVVTHAYRVLQKSGYFVVNVANIPRFEVGDRFREIAEKLFGTPVSVHSLMLQANPSYIAKFGRFKRKEPIFVFRK